VRTESINFNRRGLVSQCIILSTVVVSFIKNECICSLFRAARAVHGTCDYQEKEFTVGRRNAVPTTEHSRARRTDVSAAR